MARSAGDHQAEWWANWWDADFSWLGLARHPVGARGDVVHGGLFGEMDLQAYWRRDPETGTLRDDVAMRTAGELVIGPDGQEWHIAHLPIRWRDGSPGKVGWDSAAQSLLVTVISRRIVAAVETSHDRECRAKEPDGRAQLIGVVLTQAPVHPGGLDQVLHAVCDLSLLPRDWTSTQSIGTGFRCGRALFFDGVSFLHVGFLGNAHFARAIFSGNNCFDNTKFAGSVNFDCAIFSGAASFEKTIFSWHTRFDRVNFEGETKFADTSFSGNARFVKAVFYLSARFLGTQFAGDARFMGVKFLENANFFRTVFGGETIFSNAVFSKKVSFFNVAFSGIVRYTDAEFNGNSSFGDAIFSASASFTGAALAGNTIFDGATFSEDASFTSTTFTKNVRFSGANFLGNTNFINTAFLSDTSFIKATFSGNTRFTGGKSERPISFNGTIFGSDDQTNPPRLVSFRGWRFSEVADFDGANFTSRTEFNAAAFQRLASFRRVSWPAKAANWHGMFSQAVFKDLASFHGSGLSRFAAFDGAILQGGLQLDEVAEANANSTFQSECAKAKALSNREAALRQLEGGCRVLKQAMEKSANKSREQAFYAFELMARRHQRATPWLERLFSTLYGSAADYGRSIGRPLAWLILLIPVFTASYSAVAFGWRPEAFAGISPRAVWIECLNLSMQRIFPFGPWALTPAQLAANPVQLTLQGTPGSLFGFAIRALATMQSLCALALAFLAGLALRRRFQMN